jgi:hypothetical protein
MDRHGVRPHVRFETEVVSARWDERAGRWQVRVRDRDGREETLPARAVISAVGQLNRAKLPDIPGVEDFAGPSFHSGVGPLGGLPRQARGGDRRGRERVRSCRRSHPNVASLVVFNAPRSGCSKRTITRWSDPA